jgi:hypothetical protein
VWECRSQMTFTHPEAQVNPPKLLNPEPKINVGVYRFLPSVQQVPLIRLEVTMKVNKVRRVQA